MGKYTIDRNEWYPVYTLSDEYTLYDRTIELPENFYEDYTRILRKFRKMQNSLEFIYEEQLNKDPYYY